MPSFVRTLASLKLTVVLLVVLLVLLSWGTILESLHGAEAARAVYNAPWFYALQGLFALNVVAALWERWPRNRQRIGFLITHASMLLILGGALGTLLVSQRGHLALWEGESSRAYEREVQGGHEAVTSLPFAVRLDAFEMDVYPGTQRPSMFRSRITVVGADGREQPAVIEMNRPFVRDGWSFFQSSYQLAEGREMSVLEVARDPGQAFVFWGYYLLVLGMIVVLATRIAQYREVERHRAASRAGAAAALAIVAGALLLGAAPRDARAAQVPPAAAVETLRRLPVQSDGREMPLDTQAREAVRLVTGAPRWQGMDPVATIVSWATDPMGWVDVPILKVDASVARLAGLPPGTRHASYRQVLDARPLMMATNEALHRQEAERRPAPGDKSLLKFAERIETLHACLNGVAVRAIPGARRADPWSPPPAAGSLDTWTKLESIVRPHAPAFYPTPAAIERELRYNAVNPPFFSWLFLLPAAIAAGLTLERDRWKLRWVAVLGTLAGFAMMTWGIAMRWQVAGRIPASNMYESMLFLGWGVGLFGVISLLVRNRMLVYNAAAMSALVMLLLDRLPMDPFIRPMAPVLAGTPWLAIHVPIIMVSYSIFAIATFLAHVVIAGRFFPNANPETEAKRNQLLYWYLLVGSIFLIAGILTGSIWAASSWGRYWGWDPKEVWSLVAFLAYMAILHARSDGQLRDFGVAVWSIAAFWTILMTYLGVNFVLGSGMHAYGAGTGNLVTAMGLVALAEAAFLLAAWRAGAKADAPTSEPATP